MHSEGHGGPARRGRGQYHAVKHEQPCHTINKQDLYAQTDSAFALKNDSAILHDSQQNQTTINCDQPFQLQDSGNVTQDHMFRSQGQNTINHQGAQPNFLHNLNVSKSSPKQPMLDEDFWSEMKQGGSQKAIGHHSNADRNLTPGSSYGSVPPRHFQGNQEGNMTPRSHQGGMEGNVIPRSRQQGLGASVSVSPRNTFGGLEGDMMHGSPDQGVVGNMIPRSVHGGMAGNHGGIGGNHGGMAGNLGGMAVNHGGMAGNLTSIGPQGGSGGNFTAKNFIRVSEGNVTAANPHGNMSRHPTSTNSDGSWTSANPHGNTSRHPTSTNSDGSWTARGFNRNVLQGNMTPPSSQGGMQVGNTPPRSGCISTDQSILENILKGRIQSPMRSERSSVSSMGSPCREGMQQIPFSRKRSVSQVEGALGPPSVDSSIDAFLGEEDKQQHSDGSGVPAKKGRIQLPEHGVTNDRLVGRWTQRELEELHMFSAQLLGKHRHLASNLTSQDSVLQQIETVVQHSRDKEPVEEQTAALLQRLQQRLIVIKTTREQQQEELGVLRSRLQHQIHSQLQATPPRRLAIVPPLPRSTSATLALNDCAPSTPSTPDCNTFSSSTGMSHCSPHPHTPNAAANCSPYPSSICSPHPVASSCSPHPATPGGVYCSPQTPHTPGGVSNCSPHHHMQSSHGGTGGMGSQDQLSGTKMCSTSLDKHSSGVGLMASQGQTLLQDLLDL